jgi:transcriptional regulator with XRE-family HTH domain
MAMDNPGLLLRSARESAGISLAALAARTHFSKSLLGMIENGQRQTRHEHVLAYSRALNIPVSALLAPLDDPLRIAHEWLVTDSPAVEHQNAGRRVGASVADAMEQRVIELRHLDDAIGGRDFHPVVWKEFQAARELADNATYRDPIGIRILTVVGELAQLAGWVASDAGRYAQAQWAYLMGVSAAGQARDRVLAAQLLSSLSYQMANVGDPNDAALLARTAATGAERDATPVVRALLLQRIAWPSARSRDREATIRALEVTDDVYESRSSGVLEPEWVYWLDRGEIEAMGGRCYVELGEPARAQPLLTHAIDNYPSGHDREVALYRTWLAESHIMNGHMDAAESVLDLVKRAADDVHSSRLDRRLAEVEQLLP